MISAIAVATGPSRTHRLPTQEVGAEPALREPRAGPTLASRRMTVRSCSAWSAPGSRLADARAAGARGPRARASPSAYRLIDAEVPASASVDLPDLLAWASRLGFDGLNVTHPFKQAVVPLLDDVSDDAADLGRSTRS